MWSVIEGLCPREVLYDYLEGRGERAGTEMRQSKARCVMVLERDDATGNVTFGEVYGGGNEDVKTITRALLHPEECLHMARATSPNCRITIRNDNPPILQEDDGDELPEEPELDEFGEEGHEEPRGAQLPIVRGYFNFPNRDSGAYTAGQRAAEEIERRMLDSFVRVPQGEYGVPRMQPVYDALNNLGSAFCWSHSENPLARLPDGEQVASIINEAGLVTGNREVAERAVNHYLASLTRGRPNVRHAAAPPPHSRQWS